MILCRRLFYLSGAVLHKHTASSAGSTRCPCTVFIPCRCTVSASLLSTATYVLDRCRTTYTSLAPHGTLVQPVPMQKPSRGRQCGAAVPPTRCTLAPREVPVLCTLPLYGRAVGATHRCDRPRLLTHEYVRPRRDTPLLGHGNTSLVPTIMRLSLTGTCSHDVHCLYGVDRYVLRWQSGCGVCCSLFSPWSV